MSHPITLLPWYQNGTLSAAEREDVAEHLQGCAECRAELESLSDVRRQMHAALESDAAPSPSARRRVMQNIARAREPRPNWIGETLRSLFAMKWAPAAAMVLIALESGLLMWTLRDPATPSQPTAAPPATTQPVPPVEPGRRGGLGVPTARFTVHFVPTATEADLRALLAEVRGTIVGGPTQEGAFIIEVVGASASHAAGKVAILRERTSIVRSAAPEPASP